LRCAYHTGSGTATQKESLPYPCCAIKSYRIYTRVETKIFVFVFSRKLLNFFRLSPKSLRKVTKITKVFANTFKTKTSNFREKHLRKFQRKRKKFFNNILRKQILAKLKFFAKTQIFETKFREIFLIFAFFSISRK
jgi:hypothetical protein